MAKIYNKLVRDGIPDIIAANGEVAITTILNEETFQIALVDKLREEVAEYSADPRPEELADIMEVVLALAQERFGLSPSQIEELRAKKTLERGAFTKRIFLVETTE